MKSNLRKHCLEISVFVLVIATYLLAPSAEIYSGDHDKQIEQTTVNTAKPNIILIGVDTLRADHLGSYDYPRNTSPNIDKLAKGGTLFEKCIAPIPRTTQSVATIMTGKYPKTHGVRSLGDDLDENEVTLPEVLRQNSYTTISIVATGVLYEKIQRGFDFIIETKEEFKATQTTDHAIEILANISEPYFLWIFYRDPHMLYAPPEVLFDREYTGRFQKKLTYTPTKGDMAFRNNMSERERVHAIALYDSEIKYMDNEIGRLLDFIEKKNSNNIVIFTSDHGEGLGEKNFYYDHGDLLNQPAIHVPLIIKGIDFGVKRVDKVVRLIDIMPTILGAVGIEDVGANTDGVDLRNVVSVDGLTLDAYSETGVPIIKAAIETGRRLNSSIAARLRSVISGDMKIVYVPTEEGVVFELYNLSADPAEENNLIGTTNADDLKEKILTWVESDGEKQRRRVSAEEMERLRSLGYLT